VSSSFGSYDLSGFPKAPVWWYRSWWLANISESDAGRPPIPNTATFVRIVESWQPHPAPVTSRVIHVYSNAYQVQLQLNGNVVGTTTIMPPYGAVTYNGVAYSNGNLTAVALDANNNVLASHSTTTWSIASGIVMSIDAPNTNTGTGGAVYLDGEDVALIRATVVDAKGYTVRDATNIITFSIVGGPGYVIGCGNGDPANQDPNHAPWKPAYHGLVRAVVRTTLVAAGTPAERALLQSTNPDAGTGATASTILQGDNTNAPTYFTVQASSPGLPTVTLQVPLSTNEADSVLSVASNSVASAYIGE
jgi:hypothetical protein